MPGNISFLDDPEFLNEVEEQYEPAIEWPDNQADPRLLQGSYSSSLLFHSCERKYQLTKLNIRQPEKELSSRITFAFGHAVGTGIQDLFVTGDLDYAIWNAFRSWPEDIFAENEKQKKIFFHAVAALQKLKDLMSEGLLGDWEVAEFNGKAASELSFRIHLPNGYKERGFVDLVLRNKIDGSYAILENKTSSSNYVNATQYKNSAQAIGYSVVLDKIAKGNVDYTVQYLVWLTKLFRWEHFEFPKTHTQRALWLRDKIHDTQRIQQLVETEGNMGVWPMRGQSCMAYMRECQFLDMCHMSTENLVVPLTQKLVDGPEKETYDFEFDWRELV